MGALTIGRVGLDIDLLHPASWQERRGIEDREFVVSGYLRASSVAETKEIRSELLEQQGQLVAVTYTLDAQFDGFYILGDVRIETIPTSYMYRGLFLYEVGLFRIGGESRTEFQSNVTGTVLTNDHGLSASEVKPFFAPPIGYQALTWGASGNTSFTRSTEDGVITVWTSAGDFSEDAQWGADPTTYYSGATELYTGSPLRLRAGLDVPNTPGSWQVDNGLIRLTPESGNTGRIQIECWGGSAWESLKDFVIQVDGGSVNGWSYMSVSRNSPEAVIIRLMVGGSGTARNVLDLLLRRGAPFVIGAYSKTGANATLKVANDGALAATAVTPTGATSAVGVRATSNDGDGNRLFVFTPQAHTADTTNCGVSVATTVQLKFAVGYEIGGSGAAANDTAAECALQYFGYFGERVRAVWR